MSDEDLNGGDGLAGFLFFAIIATLFVAIISNLEKIPLIIRLIGPTFLLFIVVRFIIVNTCKIIFPNKNLKKIITPLLFILVNVIILSPLRNKLFNISSTTIEISFFISVFIFFLYGSIKIFLLFPSEAKKSRHSPNFTLPEGNKKTDIKIGTYDRNILPKLSKDFSKDITKDIYIPFNLLSKSIAILGSMGSGKSRLMQAFHNNIREKHPNIPILIHDPKGEWLRTYYNPTTDLIFAPFDERSCKWSLFNDLKQFPELIYSITSTAVELHATGNYNRFWTDSAVGLLKDALSYDTIDDARSFLIQKKKENEEDRTFLSVFSTVLLGFRDIVTIELKSPNKREISIEDLIKHKGRIFLLNNPKISGEQHGVLTIFLSAFLSHALSLFDVKDDELTAMILIDEALTFKLPLDLERAIFTQCRSKGISIISGGQRLPLKSNGECCEWYNNSGTIFAMRMTDLNSRESLSTRTGELIFKETEKDNVKVERRYKAIPPESFGNLKNREFILFHNKGIAPGKVIEILGEQKNDIPPMIYNHRKDINIFMRDL